MEEVSTLPPAGYTKESCLQKLQEYRHRLFELQNVFYADNRFGLLVIFQGPDTAGKDGTIRHVMSSMNPEGVRVHSFKKPTPEELSHDFLWRVYPHFPEKGIIQVFNRSYYEDILVPGALHSLPHEMVEPRYALINAIEQHLTLNQVHILKFFLHLSPGEQQRRIKVRKTKPHKRWKYDKADEDAARHWADYEKVQGRILQLCAEIPWHIIPADKRWYRNYLVAKILVDHLESLKLSYPTAPR